LGVTITLYTYNGKVKDIRIRKKERKKEAKKERKRERIKEANMLFNSIINI